MMKRAVWFAMAVAAAVPGNGQAESRWAAALDSQPLLTGLVQYGVLALRTQFDLTYSGLSIDPLGNRLTAHDIRTWHTPAWGAPTEHACRVDIDRLTLAGAPRNDPATLRFRVDVTGLTLQAGCLPVALVDTLEELGLRELTVPRVSVDSSYHVPSAAAGFSLSALIDDVGEFAVETAYDYLAISPDWLWGDEGSLVVHLTSASLTFDDDGLWERVAASLDPTWRDPEIGPAVLTAWLWQQQTAMLGARPSKAAVVAYAQFVRSAEQSVRQFLEAPGTLVLKTGNDPAQPILVFLEDAEHPADVFEYYRPLLVAGRQPSAPLLSADAVARALAQGGEALSPPERRAFGLALLTGEGVPRNRDRALALLDGLASEGDGAVSLALAQALADDRPERAYAHALQAAAQGVPGAIVMLDALESRVPIVAVFAAQPGLERLPDAVPADVRQLRDLAERHFDGRAGRSYVLAAYWARLAAAAGDRTAARLLDDIDQRMRALGAGMLWRTHDAQVAERALHDWSRLDMPARLGGGR
jgi:TPR repeat protein